MGKKYITVLSILVSSVTSLQAFAEADRVELLFFYEASCPHCARVERFLNERVRSIYPVEIKEFEVHRSSNARLLGRFAARYDTEVFIPTVVVGDTLIKGDERISLRNIEASVRKALRENAPSPMTLIKDQDDLQQTFNIPAILSAAAVDAINPCAFAVLTLLLGTILVGRRSKRHVIRAGLAFTASTLISYLLMGLGLFFVISISGIQHHIYAGVSILAILVGLGNIKEYVWPGKWFSMGVPRSWGNRVQEITHRVTSVPGAFAIGFLVSVLLLPCTSGPYVVVIGMLGESSTRLTAILLLLVYNIIFILPFIVITLAVGYGLTTTARLEKLRRKRLGTIHLLTGVIMLAIGTGLMLLLITGNI